MTLIHCPGHAFVVHTEPIKIDGRPGVAHKGFICKHCALKVKTVDAATMLEGKTC